MKGSFKIAEIAGISIKIHFTFLLLILIFGKWFFFVLAVFFFVTMHELAHGLMAKRFGIQVKEITLLPIGGVAAMGKMPEKPYQEFLISVAGPLSNIAIIVIFYFPLRWFVGPEVFYAAFKSFFSGHLLLSNPAFILCQVYWINLILAGFNLLPAFPMDGGRILRSILANKLGFQRATKIAVNFGHVFAIFFGYIGLTQGRLILLVIAVFIYMAASSEELQIDLKTTLKRFRVQDIVSSHFLTLQKDTPLSKVLELIFRTHQEDFPVMDEHNQNMEGFITRYDVINGVHQFGLSENVASIMRTNVPLVNTFSTLDEVQVTMQSNGLKALPVVRDGRVVGVVTTEDINRVYGIMSGKKE